MCDLLIEQALRITHTLHNEGHLEGYSCKLKSRCATEQLLGPLQQMQKKLVKFKSMCCLC